MAPEKYKKSIIHTNSLFFTDPRLLQETGAKHTSKN
jgi:hypothetical protein